MRRNLIKKWDLPSNGVIAALVILAVIFFIGGIAGCALAGQAEGGGEEVLNNYLDGYLNVVLSNEMIKPKYVSFLWRTIRWPLLVVFLGFTPIGLVGIPVAFLIRGFLLSFSISSFFRVLGTKGLLFVFSAFGITSLIYVPVLFIIGIQSLLNAGSVTGRITGENRWSTHINRSDLICCGIYFLILFLCSFFEFSMGETILKAAAEALK